MRARRFSSLLVSGLTTCDWRNVDRFNAGAGSSLAPPVRKSYVGCVLAVLLAFAYSSQQVSQVESDPNLRSLY